MRKGPVKVQNQQYIDETAPEVAASRALLSSLLGNRELLLAAVLAGPRAWRNNCLKLFQGMRFTDDMIMSMYYYLDARKGPTPELDYELAQQAREQREAIDRAETLALKELYALAHGKNHEEEEAKIARVTAAPESVRLPEIQKA